MIKKIAEIANAHEGSPERAIKIAKIAGEAGANAVKFQIYFGSDLLTKDHPRYEHFCNQSFSEKEWGNIFTESRKYNEEIIADVFGLKALEVAISNNVNGVEVTAISDQTSSIEIGDIINLVERMGIVNEEKVLPQLYEIQKQLEIEYED